MKLLCGLLVAMAVVIMGANELKAKDLPNLVPKGVTATPPRTPMLGRDWKENIVKLQVVNIGKGKAGGQLTYIEIKKENAPANESPWLQYPVRVPPLGPGEAYDIGPIEFGEFSQGHGVEIQDLREFQLVVIVDAKNMVKESNEDDNIFAKNFEIR